MIQQQTVLEAARPSPPRAPAPQPPAPAPQPGGKPKFKGSSAFHIEVRRRVEQHLRDTGRRQRDCPQMYAKTAVIFAVFAATYLGLVFVAAAWWQVLPLAVLLGLSMAAIGFNIQHDGGHQAYSDHAWVNRLTAKALDAIGGSSFLWRWKHAVLHHTYVNIAGHDTDVDVGVLGRLSPHQPHFGFHRWQHFYLWPLYGFMAIKWQLFDDFHNVATGRIGGYAFPRPRGWALATFLGGKAIFFTLAFGIPMLFHPVWAVLLTYAVTSVVVGVVLSVVFQLAHCVEEADFPLPADSGQIDNAWAIHQVETTVDFARRSRVLAWLLGGLNFQVEHHLFPRICHVNYPAISQIVEDTCGEFGVRFLEHRTLGAGVASHFRWLRRMGTPDARSAPGGLPAPAQSPALL